MGRGSPEVLVDHRFAEVHHLADCQGDAARQPLVGAFAGLRVDGRPPGIDLLRIAPHLARPQVDAAILDPQR